MNRYRTALLAVAVLAAAARADSVTLTTTNPPGSPLPMVENSASSTLTVRVVNLNPPVDRMTGWFMTLSIVADPGTTGTLTFNTPATGSPPHPPNYIFAQSFVGIGVTNTGSQLKAFDDDQNINGTPVPQAGASLLDLTFLAGPSTTGTFGVYALPGLTNTGWTDQTGSTQFFQNVPSTGSPVLIGQVTVVPEPGCVLAVVGLASLAFARRAARHQPAGT